MDEKFDRSFRNVAVAEFRFTSADQFDFFAACDALFQFLDQIKSWTLGLRDLIGEPIVKTADSLFACFLGCVLVVFVRVPLGDDLDGICGTPNSAVFRFLHRDRTSYSANVVPERDTKRG